MCSSGSQNGVVFGSELSPTTTSFKKRHRIPKRGPGVAELEKILREQHNNNQPRRFTSPDRCSLEVVHRQQQPYFSHPLQGFNNNNNNNNDNNNWSLVEKQTQVVPISPLTWTNHDRKESDGGNLFGRVVPKQYFHSPTSSSLISPFPGSAALSVGLGQGIEAPSSQRYLNNYTLGQQDHKFVGMKRGLSSDQIPPFPPLKHRAPEKKIPNFCKPIITRESDFNYFPSCDMEVPRFPEPEGNFFKYLSPNIAHASVQFQVLKPQSPKFDHTDPKQEKMNKPFYSFLPSNDQTETKGASYGIENKAGEDGIDLSLKLSTI